MLDDDALVYAPGSAAAPEIVAGGRGVADGGRLPSGAAT